MSSATLAAPAILAEMVSHRDAMLRFARRKIRDQDLAEDAVQDALTAALTSHSNFRGQSALRTWLIGILNHKIQDVYRRESRFVRAEAEEADDQDWAEIRVRNDGSASAHGEQAPDPAVTLERTRLHERLVAEIEALPQTLREVFTMQALEGVETEEVCRRLSITEANCWVRLHRARKRLSSRLTDQFA